MSSFALLYWGEKKVCLYSTSDLWESCSMRMNSSHLSCWIVGKQWVHKSWLVWSWVRADQPVNRPDRKGNYWFHTTAFQCNCMSWSLYSVPAVLMFRKMEGTNRIGLTSWNWLTMLQLASRAWGALYQDRILICTSTVDSIKNEHWELLGLFSWGTDGFDDSAQIAARCCDAEGFSSAWNLPGIVGTA